MSHVRLALAFALLLAAQPVSAQNNFVERPKPYDGPKATSADKERRESLYRYAYGLLCEKEDRMLEALTAFEEAAELDPNAPGVYKAQVPLLLMLDRPRDALAALKRVLQLDPTDHDSWFLAARLHKGLGEMKAYRKALDKGLATPGLVDEKPQLAQQFYFDLAQYLESNDEIPDAIAAYTASAKILDHPDAILDHGPFLRESIIAKCAETYEKVGDLQRRLKNYDAAIAAYRTAQMRQPDVAGRINLNLAKVYNEKNVYPEALAAVEGYLRLMPQGMEAYQLKIDLLTKLNRSNDVLIWLQQATNADGLNVNLKLLFAQQLAARNKLGPAEEVFLDLANDSPSEDVYRGLFRLPRADGGRFLLAQFDKAVRGANADKKAPGAGSLRSAEQARAILAVLKDDAAIARKLLDAAHGPDQADKDLNFETRFFLAMLADKYGKLDQAEKFYRRALEAPGQINEGPLYYGLMRILWKAHKYEEIIRTCETGLKTSQFTNRLLFYRELGLAHARLGDFRKAEAAAQKAIEIATDRDVLLAQQLHVRVLMQAEKYAQAEAACKKLMQELSGPADILEVRYLLSGVYSAWKKMDLCEQQLLEILKTDPTNATAHNDLGYVWADHNKNLKESEELIRKAIDLDRQQRKAGSSDDKDNANYVDSLGWVLFRRGDFDGARKELERAVSLPDGDEPALWDHLGDVYARMGRFVQAQAAYQRAVELYEQERVRAKDERYRDVVRKLDQVKTQVRAK